MPVVRMEIVDVDQIPKGSVQRLVDELGDILGSEDGHTWLRITTLRIAWLMQHRPIDQCSSKCSDAVALKPRRQKLSSQQYWIVIVIMSISHFQSRLWDALLLGGTQMSGDPLDEERMSRLETFAGDAEIDALWAKFAESINKAQKDSNHPVETLQAMAVALAALGEGGRQMLLQLIDQKRSA